jgi:hypothetical protein
MCCDMKWFRSNIKRVSQLALFALAVQFALSFDHFHGVAPQAPFASQSASVSSEIAFAGRFTDPAAVSSPSQPPASDHGGEHPGDICAICAVMAMASSIMFAAPPVLLLPRAVEFAYLVPDADLVRVHAVRPGFQPRAPPIS